MFNYIRNTTYKFKLYKWISCWLDFFQGLIGILTLGIYKPEWSYRFFLAYTLYILRKRMEEND